MKFKQHGKRPDWRALLAVWLTLAFLTAAGFAAYSAWQTSRIGFAAHFVDVGQGDGAIVVCDGKTLVIDGGTAENGAKMVEYLQNTLHVSKVDFVIGTHPHADHIGGLPDVIRACKVKKLYSPVDEFEAKTFETMKRAADDKKLKITVPQAEFFARPRAGRIPRAAGHLRQCERSFSRRQDHVWADGFPVYGRRGKAVRIRYDRQQGGLVRHGAQSRPSWQQHVHVLCLSAAGYAGLRHHQLRKGQCLRPSA